MGLQSVPVILMAVMLVAGGASAQAPSLEGTYRLVSRTLPDGKVLTPPEILGLWTYTKTHRSFALVRKDAAGKVTSRTLVSTYTMTPTEYAETLVFHVRTDQIGGKEPVYELTGETRRAPVTTEAGAIQLKLPFEGMIPARIEGSRITATSTTGGVDVWEKVP